MAILNSLAGGVVPNRGLEYIMVGRKEEATQIFNDLDTVEKGSSRIIGKNIVAGV
ncbi:BREX system ATP-binding domain-containing protein [Ammoniphilus sp. 3BR4]